jgi:hypothetical protein
MDNFTFFLLCRDSNPDASVVQHVASRYTDFAIPTPPRVRELVLIVNMSLRTRFYYGNNYK